MHKVIAFILTLILISSCDNTLDINAPWQDIPVVYGLLVEQDATHYIRIEKAFLDSEESAFNIARKPDSLFYTGLDVEIIHVNSGDRFTMGEVDGNLEGLQREMGVFAESPNVLYKIEGSKINLQRGDKYRLSINRSESLPLVTAETFVVDRPDIKVPLPGNPIRFNVDNDFRVNWIDADLAGFYDVKIVFHFLESDPQNQGSFIEKSLDWKFARKLRVSETQIQGREFYEYLAASLTADPSIDRVFLSLDVVVEAAGEELDEFIRITQANTGITSVGGDIPQFSNISEGIGIFSSINFDLQGGYDLHPETLDSLKNGSITGNLGF